MKTILWSTSPEKQAGHIKFGTFKRDGQVLPSWFGTTYYTSCVTNLNQLKMIGWLLIQVLNLRYQIACNLFVTLPLQLSKKPKQTRTPTHKLFKKLNYVNYVITFSCMAQGYYFFPPSTKNRSHWQSKHKFGQALFLWLTETTTISNFCDCTDELHDTQILDGSNPFIFSTYCQKHKVHGYCFISKKGLAQHPEDRK